MFAYNAKRACFARSREQFKDRGFTTNIKVALKALAITLCLIAQIPSARATTYYVSTSQGNDANPGIASNAPWKTLTSVYNFTEGVGFRPGDSILLKAGDSFDGPLYVHQSGSNGVPITIGHYGTGPSPIIYGDHPGATWSAVPGHPGLYSALLGPSGLISIQYVYDYSGIKYTKSLQGTNTLEAWLSTFTANTWGGVNTVYVRTSDGNPPSQLRVIEHSVISANSVKYVTFQNLEVCNGFIGIQPGYCSHFLAQNNFIHDTFNSAIYFSGCTSSTMASNTVINTGSDPLYLAYGGDNWIHHNVCSNCGYSVFNVPAAGDKCGIGLQQGTNNLVEYNSMFYVNVAFFDYYYEVNTEVRYNYGFHCGQAADTDGTGLLFHHNVFDMDGVGHGILGAQAYDPTLSPISNNIPTLIYNNVVYNCNYYGLYTSSGNFSAGMATNIIFRNNIVVTTQTNIVPLQLFSGADSDYNLYYCTVGAPKGYNWNNLKYNTLATMQTGSGQEKHSIYAAPQFVSSNPVSAADFKLKSTSPCINSGQDLKLAGLLAPSQDYKDYLGTLIPQGNSPDIGAYEARTLFPASELHVIRQ